MKRKQLLFILLLAGTFMFAQSPITLSNSNMPGSGDTLRYTNIQISSLGNYTQTGVNYNWNFYNVISTTEGVRTFKSALQTPYALLFLSLNEYGEKIADTIGAGPVTFTKYYNFYKKQTSPNAFIADGAGVTFNNVPLPSYYSDKDELYNFPMSYPKYDSTSFKFSTITTTLIPVSYSKTGYRVTRVDGWGTVTTPFGTANCLRLVTTQYAMDSIKTNLGPISFPVGFQNFQRSYQWMTTTSKIPFLEITGSLVAGNFTPTLARYRGYEIPVNTTGLNDLNKNQVHMLYPNPVNDQLRIQLHEPAQVLLFDAQGKLLRADKAEVIEGGYVMDVSALPAGIYFIKAGPRDSQSNFKFIKQ